MSSIPIDDESGPAFPSPVDASLPGMSLRDWFAGMILPVIYKNELNKVRRRESEGFSDREVTDEAYMIAEEMLKSRQK